MFILSIYIFILSSFPFIYSQVTVNVQEIEIGQKYSFSIDNQQGRDKVMFLTLQCLDVVEYLLHFKTLTSRLSREAIQSKISPLLAETVATVKIQTSVSSISSRSLDSPLLFSLRYNFINEGWKLPYSNRSRSLHYEKWLCPLLSQGATDDVTVSVYTASKSSIQFSIEVQVVQNFQVGLDQFVNVGYISAAAPVMYYIGNDNIK